MAYSHPGWRVAADGRTLRLTSRHKVRRATARRRTLEEWVDFFRDPDEFYNATVSALLR